MSVLTIEGQPVGVLEKAVGYADIPSDLNKAYMEPLDEDGGIGAKLGGAYDPAIIALEETLTQDRLPAGLTNYKPYITVLVGIGILFLILKVAK